jgi:NodT family efflux transporter outer membrane factor (OMF) lipoprotein
MGRKLIVLACALLAGGCSVDQPKPVEETGRDALPETTQIPLDYQAAADVALGDVQDGWLASFNDPQLEALVVEALEHNLNLQAAIARVDAAAGYAVQASAELKPAVGLGGSLGSQEGFSSSDPALSTSGLQLNASWELDLWGRVRAQAAAGEAAFEAAQFQLEWVYRSLAAQTAKTWFLVSETRMQQELAEEALGLYQRTEGIISAKFEQGQVTKRELALARANVASGQVAVRQAQGARQQATRALEVILGRYPAAAIEGAEEFVPVPPPIPAGIPSELLERRPDLRAAERAVAAQFFQIQSAEAARLPRITLTGGLGTSSNELVDIISLGSDFWAAGVNFAAPLYTGGALEAQVDIESAQFKEAMANYGSAALRAFSEVEQGLSNETLLREREGYLEELLSESQEALRVADTQFNVGKVDFLNVLQQQGQVISARSSLLNIRDQRLQQRVDLHLALGGDFEEQ